MEKARTECNRPLNLKFLLHTEDNILRIIRLVENRIHLFAYFFQLHRQTKYQNGGTNLGDGDKPGIKNRHLLILEIINLRSNVDQLPDRLFFPSGARAPPRAGFVAGLSFF